MKFFITFTLIFAALSARATVISSTEPVLSRRVRSGVDESIIRRYLESLPSDYSVVNSNQRPAISSLIENYVNAQLPLDPPKPPKGSDQQTAASLHWSSLDNYYKKVHESSLDAADRQQLPILLRDGEALVDLMLGTASGKTARQPVGYPPRDLAQLMQLYAYPTPSYQSVSHQPAIYEQKQPYEISRVNADYKSSNPYEQLMRMPAVYANHAGNQPDFSKLVTKGELDERAEGQHGAWQDRRRPTIVAPDPQLSQTYCSERNYIGVESRTKAGSFPSHVGVYQGEPNDNNYLCAGVWVHERLVLTLASCVANRAQQNQQLQARLGEWSLTNIDTSKAVNSLIVLQVEQVIVHPGYLGGSAVDDNLALLKLVAKPNKKLPFVSPACRLRSISANACWAPLRKVKSEEYFDADGEGEIKERNGYRMAESPIKLVVSNEAECRKQTGVEHYNYQFPKYICSEDCTKKLSLRAALNRTNFFGAGIYCNEGGHLSLVSILHPLQEDQASQFGYLNLSYYKAWIDKIVSIVERSDILMQKLLSY